MPILTSAPVASPSHVLARARDLQDRLRRLGVDVDGPGYDLQRPFSDPRHGPRPGRSAGGPDPGDLRRRERIARAALRDAGIDP